MSIAAEIKKADPTKRVVLVGASIGKAWHFDRITERVALPGYRFGYVGTYDFDKTPLIQDLLKDPDRPQIVLIKECSTYFPGDLNAYRKQVTGWVDQLRAAGIQPMLVTTAPCGKPGAVDQAKNIIKRVIGKPVWHEDIAQFNDWINDYGRSAGIPVFDLEAVLRQGPSQRWLKSEYDVGDAVHLTEAAYREMDREFAKFASSWPKAAPKP